MRNPGLTRIAIALGLTVAIAAAGCGGDDKKVTNPPPATKELDSVSLTNGMQYEHRFFSNGTFPYHCKVHPSMTASVTVNAGAPAGDSLASVSITGNTFSPATVTIHTGGKVTWTTLDGAIPHTVTSD